MKKSDLFIGIYILAAIVFLIISIPSGLLDVFLAFNIAIALTILFVALFSKEPLDMQAFPTILLSARFPVLDPLFYLSFIEESSPRYI